MKISELRSKSDSELKEVVLQARKELFNIRFQKSGGADVNVSVIPFIKKKIARAKTLLTERNENVSL